MESLSGWFIAAGIGVGALVLKIYPPRHGYRPLAYTFVTLLFGIGVVTYPLVMAELSKLPGAPLLVFLVTGAICTGAFVITRHSPVPPPSSNVAPPNPSHAPTPAPSSSSTAPAVPPSPPPEEAVPEKRAPKPHPSASGNNSPIVTQSGQNNIAQFGNNNQATIISREERKITDTQIATLIEKLRPFAGPKVRIRVNQATNESTQFALRVAQALRSAGIEVIDVEPVMSFGAADYIPHMAFVVDWKQNQQSRLAVTLGESLVSMGIIKKPYALNPEDSEGNPDYLIIDVFPIA